AAGLVLVLVACAPASGGTTVAPTTAPAAVQPTTAPAAATTAPTVAPTSAPTVAPTVALPATVQIRDDATLGKFLTDATGRTLYKFNRDTPNVSACVDACTQTWPPLAAPASGNPVAPARLTGALPVLTRPDSPKQAAYNGS